MRYRLTKTGSGRRAAGLFVAAAAIGFSTVRAGAWPSSSPSARVAARLKYKPPHNWLQHYLGDDRYKIAGGTWKVLSTQNDTYYHRANCPNMLRQPAGIVIGFPAAAHAREAGYLPDPTCSPDYSSVSYAGGGAGSGAMGKGQRIKLSDGVSTIIVPSGWTHRTGPVFNTAEMRFTSDILSAPRRGHLDISTMHLTNTTGPDGKKIDIARMLTPQMLRSSRAMSQRFVASMQNSPSATPQNRELMNKLMAVVTNQKIEAYRLGGLQGVRIIYGSKRVAGMPWQSISVGAGSNLYSISDSTSSPSVANSIIRSFRPR